LKGSKTFCRVAKQIINFAAMLIEFYDPFEKLNFNPETCFLTGQHLSSSEEQITVFPKWILDRYSLHDVKFTMMDQISSIRYQDLKIPCSHHVFEKAITPLEEEIETAFSAGYEEVIKVPEERLFQWMAKLVYGVLYNDFKIEQGRAARKENEFKLSPYLLRKFRNLHLMLQSLVVPMEFKGIKPWSISIVKIKISKDVFNYKDEPTNLNFSLGMNDFGIVACLQDNGAVGTYQQEMIKKISGKTLHPIQFEEICGRFIYANYLLKHFSEYNIPVTEEKVIIEAIPLAGSSENKSLFGPWDDNMFAQVLADYWKPWGITKKQIFTFPDSPISYLENDYDYSFIEPESIPLPY
jgi:hypothetical protein